MFISSVTDDYNEIMSINNNCTDNEKNIDLIIPAILFTIPSGISFLCLISLMVYTLVKPLINKK